MESDSDATSVVEASSSDEEGDVLLRRRLRAFVPETTRVVVWRVQDVEHEVDDVYAEFGFRRNRKQHNFLKSHAPNRFVALLHTSDGADPPPRHIADPTVVARAFGEVRAGDDGPWLELWYLGVRREHPLNDSKGGTRWGFYGIAPYERGAKVRWRTRRGVNLTKRNATQHVRGTPNPYATRCLVEFATWHECTLVYQNPEMPCAHLFDAEFSHKTHPATLLLFLALGFRRPRDLDHYAWRGTPASLRARWEGALAYMRIGSSVIVA